MYAYAYIHTYVHTHLRTYYLYMLNLNFCSGLDQPPRFILEPQDAVLPTVIGTNSVSASIHCSHNSVNTTVTWFRNGVPLTYTANRILRDNGTVEFRPLIAAVDVTTEGVRYFCVLSNAFGSVISRTALLQSASKSTLHYTLSYCMLRTTCMQKVLPTYVGNYTHIYQILYSCRNSFQYFYYKL